MINLSNVLETSSQRVPDREALVCGERRLTFGEVEALSAKLATALSERGVGPGDMVALACPNIPEFVISYFAILKAGGVVVPVSLLLKTDEIVYILQKSKAVAFLCVEEGEATPIGGFGRAAFDQVGHCQSFIRISRDGNPCTSEEECVASLLAQDLPPLDTVQRNSDDTAVVIFTSGTTGKPKGAELTHGNLLTHCLMQQRMQNWQDDEVMVVALPLFHVYGQICQMAAGMGNGVRLILIPKFEPRAVLHWMRKEKATRYAGVPTMYWALLNHPDTEAEDGSSPFDTLRTASCGAAPMPVEMLKRFEERYDVRVQEGYGLSECSPSVTTHYFGLKRKPGTCGKPVWGTRVEVVDDDDNILPTGERGEIVIRGHHVMKGYLDDPEATAEALRGGWFHTGDIGVIDEEGYLTIVDRKKEMIIRGGMNVYPREIEEVLMSHPEVSLVAVIGVPDERVGQEVKAVVVRREGSSLTEEAMIAWAKEKMAAYKYPRSVEFRDALPTNATGKIQKRALLEVD